MGEFLVIFACLNSTGCKETSTHYYNTHPQMQEIIKANEQRIKHYIGPVFVETFAPMLAFSLGGTGNIRLNKYFNLQINKDSNILGFSREF